MTETNGSEASGSGVSGSGSGSGFVMPRLPSLGHRNELASGTFFTPNPQQLQPSSPGHPLSPGTITARPPKKARTGSELPVSVAEDVGSVMDFSSNEDDEKDELEEGTQQGDDDESEMYDDDDDGASVTTTSSAPPPPTTYSDTVTAVPLNSATIKQKKPSKTKAAALKATKGKGNKGKGKGRADGQVSDETSAAAASLLLAAEGAPQRAGAGAGAGSTTMKKTHRKNASDKKKKAGRACAACQKAHLTCDDARPCSRCVKKNIAADCHDGTRKKAKYLQEIPDELLERKNTNPFYQPSHDQLLSGGEDATPLSGITGESPEMMLGETPQAQQEQQPTLSFEPTPFFDTSAFSNEFGSEAANLEYAILSSMLNGNGFSIDGAGNAYDVAASLRGADSGPNAILINSPLDPTGANGSPANGGASTNAAGPSNATSFFNFRPGSTTTSPSFGGNVMSPPRLQDTARDLFPPAPGTGIRAEGPSSAGGVENAGFGQDLFADEGPPRPEALNSTSGGAAVPGSATRPNVTTMTGEQAYRAVTKPYPYAQSYHYLVKHLKDRFEKNDILRIIRALATFRPSLIALQMPLTEEDETFVERTFQRTLVELNKLISFSGTPTVVWRRTGEICLVGTEFCLLTGWQREELVGHKFMFELMDTSSVVEYYESFAKHAFESTSSSVEMQCVVLGPNGRPVPCAMCFTIRRDLFSCPFLIVGSFLPILV